MSSRHAAHGDPSNEFPLLNKIQEANRGKVVKILNLKMPIDDKLKRLEDFMTVSQLKECRLWMEKKAGDFLSLLTDSDQEFAEEYLEKKDTNVLDAILKNYDGDTAAVYELWKRNSGLVPNTAPSEEETPSPVKGKKGPGKKTKKPETESENESEEKSEASEEEEEEKPKKKKDKEQKSKKDKKDKTKKKTKRESDESDGSEDEKETKKKTKKDKKEGKKEKKTKKDKKKKTEAPPVLTNADLGTDSQGFRIPANFFNTMRPVTNILILGSTGVGKSTFINGLVNYLTFESMEEAKEKGFHVLIRTGFSHTDERMRSIRVEMEPTIAVEKHGHGHDEDEDLREGQSATQAPKSYVFQVGPPNQERMIRIIDTPGVGDVRGTVQDQKNFTRILNFIADFEEIHAILLLLEPNKARLDLTFRYCINELLTHLHASAARNILFCFTKARQTFYRPGESFNCLRTHLDNLYEKTRIEVPLNETNMFTFDNESFRFLCAWKKGAEFNGKDIENFGESWSKAVEQNFKMLQRIEELRPHKVSDTLSVNNIRLLISTLARPLAELARNQLVNVRLIEEKLQEIEECLRSGRDIQGKLFMETVHIDTEELDQPITVCTHKDCVEYRQLNNGGVVETIYKTECHVPCYLEGVETSICPNPELQKCEVFADEDSCFECKHSWQTHMHMLYRLKQTITRTEDPMARKNMRNKDDQVAAGRRFIAEKEEERDARQCEMDKIMHYCAHFAAFLKKYSIVPYNDAYLEYLQHLIKEENNKVSSGGTDNLLKELEAFKDLYEQQSNIFKDEINKGMPLKTLAELYDMVNELKTLTFSGQIVQEVQNIELLSVRAIKQHNHTVVPVNIFKRTMKGIVNGVSSLFGGN